MPPLIDPERRARARSEREARRRALLDSAREVFSSRPFTELTLEGISRRAGVPSGSAALLFATVEELFLQVADHAAQEWIAEVDAALTSGHGQLGRGPLVRLVVGTLVARTDLMRLLGHLPAVLERPMDLEAVTGFLARQHRRLCALGDRLEACDADLEPGDGVRLLWGLWRGCAGVEPFVRPVGALAVALLGEDLAELRLDREAELIRIAFALLAEPAGS